MPNNPTSSVPAAPKSRDRIAELIWQHLGQPFYLTTEQLNQTADAMLEEIQPQSHQGGEDGCMCCCHNEFHSAACQQFTCEHCQPSPAAEPKSYFDYSDDTKQEILSRAAKASSEAQRKLLESGQAGEWKMRLHKLARQVTIGRDTFLAGNPDVGASTVPAGMRENIIVAFELPELVDFIKQELASQFKDLYSKIAFSHEINSINEVLEYLDHLDQKEK